MVYFQVAMMTGVVLGSPWIFYHIWAFIASGLYPHEKRYINVYLPFSVFLFVGEHWARRKIFPNQVFPGLRQQLRDTWSVWKHPDGTGLGTSQ